MISTDNPKREAGPLPAGLRALIVEARYYEGLADELLAGATGALDEAGVPYDVLTVDGALEIAATLVMALSPPRSAASLGRTFRSYDLAVVLGCVIRGETGHYDIVAGESARAVTDLSVRLGMPIGNGILTVENEDQAWARARVSEMNKGGGAANAALSVLRAVRQLEDASLG